MDVDAVGFGFVDGWNFKRIARRDEQLCVLTQKAVDMDVGNGALDKRNAEILSERLAIGAEIKDLIAFKAHDADEGMAVIDETLGIKS